MSKDTQVKLVSSAQGIGKRGKLRVKKPHKAGQAAEEILAEVKLLEALKTSVSFIN